MGFLRKATFVATGGASGLVLKANSKKERQAKALEKMAKSSSSDPAEYLQPIVHDDDEPGIVTLSLTEELRSLAELRDQGVLTEDEFAACKAKLLA